MRARGVVVLAIGVLIQLGIVPAAEARTHKTRYDSAVLAYTCRVLGGEYFPPSAETQGGYGCLLPDGTQISCTPDGDCDVTTPREVSRPSDWRVISKVAALLHDSVKVSAAPDLVPLPTPASTSPEGFCRRNVQGQLLVKIVNQGGSDAAASKTRVRFGTAAPTDVDTPALTGRTSTELVISIPNACFDVNNNCAFTVGADATEVAAESNETNNNAAGLCGPQFF